MYAILYLYGVHRDVVSGVLIPLVMIIVAGLVVSIRSRGWWVFPVLVFLGGMMTGHFAAHVTEEHFRGKEFQPQRIENYSFSWHIAKEHPWLGMGLGSPEKVQELNGYEVHHPALKNNKNYAAYVKWMPTKTMDSIFLTFLSDLGIPFLIVYLFALVGLLARLIGTALRPLRESAMHPLVLILPITGIVAHSVIDDTFIYPQVCWFFHILLGLIPQPATESVRIPVRWKQVFVRAAAVAGAVAVGLFIGTHPLFQPGEIGIGEKISSGVKELPLVALLYKVRAESLADKKGSERVGRGATSTGAESSEAGKSRRTSIGKQSEQGAKGGKGSALEEEPRLPGKLVATIRDYRGENVRWGLMVMLDNSETMLAKSEPWSPSRFRAAVDLLDRVTNEITDGSEMAVRCFSAAFSLTKDGHDFPVSVSRVLLNWTRCPIVELPHILERIEPCQQTNPCAAAAHSAGTDFAGMHAVVPRVLMISDGKKRCAVREVMSSITEEESGARPVVDMILFGNGASDQQRYEELARESGGFFSRLDGPSDLESSVARYCSVLKTPKRGQIIVRGDKTTRRVLPGDEITLPPGMYELVMPPIAGVAASDRLIREMRIRAGKTTSVDVSVHGGRLEITSAIR
ncbi:MAG: O-antigen ligase family protein, partial [Deltaproteobacteria bacterium]